RHALQAMGGADDPARGADSRGDRWRAVPGPASPAGMGEAADRQLARASARAARLAPAPARPLVITSVVTEEINLVGFGVLLHGECDRGPRARDAVKETGHAGARDVVAAGAAAAGQRPAEADQVAGVGTRRQARGLGHQVALDQEVTIGAHVERAVAAGAGRRDDR